MEMIKHLQIKNYKSIKHLDLDCSRINVFVGRPNVGKSNILEALDLSYLSWLLLSNKSIAEGNSKLPNADQREFIDIKKFFRVDGAGDLFYLGDLSKVIAITTGGFSADFDLSFNKNIFEWRATGGALTQFDNNFYPSDLTKEHNMYFGSMIKPYKYQDAFKFHDEGNYMDSLMPPFGNNIGSVIRYNPSVKHFIDELTKDTGIEFNIDTKTDKITIQRRVNKGLVFTLPFQSLADTFRRILFYIAAIRSNRGYAITLEEPEAHSFPPYISLLADEIIQSYNQFFIATHSPYLLTNLIENTPTEDLSVFVCDNDNDNFQTTAKKLTQEDLSELLDYGVDIFFNINRYLDDRIEHNS